MVTLKKDTEGTENGRVTLPALTLRGRNRKQAAAADTSDCSRLTLTLTRSPKTPPAILMVPGASLKSRAAILNEPLGADIGRWTTRDLDLPPGGSAEYRRQLTAFHGDLLARLSEWRVPSPWVLVCSDALFVRFLLFLPYSNF